VKTRPKDEVHSRIKEPNGTEEAKRFPTAYDGNYDTSRWRMRTQDQSLRINSRGSQLAGPLPTSENIIVAHTYILISL